MDTGTIYKQKDFDIDTLGDKTFENPKKSILASKSLNANFIDEDTSIPYRILSNDPKEYKKLHLEMAGPSEKIFFNPEKCSAAIVTCGGLCPGLNDVIRSIVMELFYGYNVKRILGIPFGYRGLNPHVGGNLIPLTPEKVKKIHKEGGTILGSSRGSQDMNIMVDTLMANSIDILFCIGGDGTLTGAHHIAQTIKKRNLKIGVLGIPKTIDNDIMFCYKSFGFDTAVELAQPALRAAQLEAKGAPNGIGLVKLMGRDSGFIATYASLASGDVNFTLIPELKFRIKGRGAFLEQLETRLTRRGSAVICVSEGAGQELIPANGDGEKDASGNKKLGDIGAFLKKEIETHFKEKKIALTLKYIDPSYIIRSAPTNASDSIFCGTLGRCAVHAAMSGRTNCMVGRWHNYFNLVPLKLIGGLRKKVDLAGDLWRNLLESTGQPGDLWGQD